MEIFIFQLQSGSAFFLFLTMFGRHLEWLSLFLQVPASKINRICTLRACKELEKRSCPFTHQPSASYSAS
jgi:hypothetical protein